MVDETASFGAIPETPELPFVIGHPRIHAGQGGQQADIGAAGQNRQGTTGAEIGPPGMFEGAYHGLPRIPGPVFRGHRRQGFVDGTAAPPQPLVLARSQVLASTRGKQPLGDQYLKSMTSTKRDRRS